MRHSRLIPAALSALVLTSAAIAQTNTTALSGTVADSSGGVIPGATVSLTDTTHGSNKVQTSRSNGTFEFPQLAPGHYRVTVTAPGFSTSVQELDLLVASPRQINVSMTVGATDTVTVQATAPAVNTTDASLGKPFDSTQVQNLPYPADNVLSLLSLQPGVQSLDPGSKNGGLNQDARTGIVNGARQDQSNVTLDGVDDNDQNNGFAFYGILRSTRDSVEEFRVVTSNPNADSGRSSGAQVSLVTRSGTNQFHGSAYEYYRDPGVASNDWFYKQSQLSTGAANVAAKILQHTYGGSFGMPLLKDKLFFFGAYEGFKQASDTVVTNTVPSVLNPVAGLPTLNGYGGLITGTVSYINSSGSVTTLNAAQIASMDPNCSGLGTCPAGPGVNAAAIAYFKQFPAANTNTTGDSYNTGGYTFASPAPQSLITNIAKIDYNITPKQVVFVRANLQSDNQTSAVQFLGGPPNTNTYGNSKGIAAGHIWNITDNLTNNFRYGFIRQGQAVRGASHSDYVTFDAVTSLTSTNTSSLYKVPVNNIIDDLTFVKGRHTIQAGMNDRFLSNYRYQDFPLYATGASTADLLSTAAIAGQTGSSLDPGTFGYAPVNGTYTTFYNAAILAATGTITESQQYVNSQVSGNTLTPLPQGTVQTRHYKSLEQEYYLQDAWKVMPRLTITGGLRYTYLGVPYETNGQEVAPTISLPTFLANRVAAAASGAAAAGNPYNTRISVGPAGTANGKPNLWTPEKGNFAPRIAFAYATPDNKTSVRGGWGIVFDHFGQGVINDYDANGAFTLSTQMINYYGDVDDSPRFTSASTVPVTPITGTTQTFPITPADQTFSFVSSIDNKLKTPYAETFNFTVQHEFPKGLSVTATYVGRLGRHVLANLDVAQPSNVYDPVSGQNYYQAATAYDKQIDQGVSPTAIANSGYFQNIFPAATFAIYDANGNQIGTYTGAQAIYASLAANRGNETNTLYINDTNNGLPASIPGSYRFFFPQYSSIYIQSSTVSSNYNALQLSARQSLKSGIIYDFNYTYGKSMDFGSDPERKGQGTNRIINTFNPSQNYAVSDYDIRHNITADYIIALPFGHNKRFAGNANHWVDAIIGGWTLDGLVHYSSGLPFSASSTNVYGTNFAEPSYMVQTGPIATGGHRYVVDDTGPHETALKNQTVAQAQANLRYAYPGEAGQRNNFRSDGYLSLDNGLSKSFRIYKETTIKLNAEVFNVLNDVRFNALATDSSGESSNFSQTTNGTSTLFGTYASLLVQPRQMQFSAKYNF